MCAGGPLNVHALNGNPLHSSSTLPSSFVLSVTHHVHRTFHSALFGLFNLSESGTMTVDEAILAFRSASIGLVKAGGGVPPLDVDLELAARQVGPPSHPHTLTCTYSSPFAKN